MTLKLKKKTIKIKQSDKYTNENKIKRGDKEERLHQDMCKSTPKL